MTTTEQFLALEPQQTLQQNCTQHSPQQLANQDISCQKQCQENSSQQSSNNCVKVVTLSQQIKNQQCQVQQPKQIQNETVNTDIKEDILQNVVTLEKVKSTQQLQVSFEQNQKIMSSLAFNIDDLFKKISSLTEQVKIQLQTTGLSKSNNNTVSSMDKIQSPRRKIQAPLISNSQKLISLKEPQIITLPQTQLQLQILKHQLLNQVIVNDNQLSMRMFQIGQSLGYGKFGQVLQCRHKQTGYLFALKKIFKSSIQQYKMSQQLLTELKISKKMNHPNIIKSYTAFTDDYHIFLINQYALGCQLNKKFNSSQEDASKIIKQVLEGVRYMHGVGVVHRDLKPQNILIDQCGMIKICDFGWSSIICQENQSKMSILCGTLDYVSPQMVNQQSYTKQIDLWSVGVLTYELIFGVAPFKAQTKSTTFEKVRKLEYNLPGSYRFSNECIDFITKLLKPEGERMKIQECLEHPFIINYENKKDEVKEILQEIKIQNVKKSQEVIEGDGESIKVPEISRGLQEQLFNLFV